MSIFRRTPKNPDPPSPELEVPHRKVVECRVCRATRWTLTRRTDGLWDMRCPCGHLFLIPGATSVTLDMEAIYLNN